MMRNSVLCLLAAAYLHAQSPFTGLATTPDGETLYFASTLRQTNSGQPEHGQIFRIGPRGLEAIRSRLRTETLSAGFPQALLSNLYAYSAPLLNPKGDFWAAQVSRDCSQSTNPICWETTFLEDGDSRSGGWLAATNGPYSLQVAASGRIVRELKLISSAAPLPTASVVTRWPLGTTASNFSRYFVTRTGLPFANDGVLVHWRPGEPNATRVPSIRFPGGGWDDPLSPSVFVQVFRDQTYTGPWHVAEIDSAALEVRQVWPEHTEACGSFQNPTGRLFALCRRTSQDRAQVWIAEDAAANGLRPLTEDSGGILNFTVSASGKVVWFVTGRGELKKLHWESGRLEVPVGPTLWWPFAFVSPGGRDRMTGTWLGEGLRNISWGGVSIQILRREVDSLDLLTPWQAFSLASFAVQVDRQGGSMFDVPTGSPFLLVPSTPRLLYAADGTTALVAHGDWSGLVTPASPARPGEILHVYATGLGAVKESIADGAPAPINRAVATIREYRCGWLYALPDFDVLFSGLAPGLVNYYQLTFALPVHSTAFPTTGTAEVSCSAPDGSGLRISLPFRLP